MLARKGIDADCAHCWAHPLLSVLPSAARRLVQHRELFPHVMRRASQEPRAERATPARRLD